MRLAIISLFFLVSMGSVALSAETETAKSAILGRVEYIDDFVPRLSEGSGAVKICVDGYKYLVVFGPRGNGNVRSVGVTQMFETTRVGNTLVSAPSKCIK